MACRPAYFIALLLAMFCFFLPACRQTPRVNQPQTQAALTKHNLSVAIYRFWSGAVPFCDQYVQFAALNNTPVRSQYSLGEWIRVDYVGILAQPSAHQSCRYKEHSIGM